MKLAPHRGKRPREWIVVVALLVAASACTGPEVDALGPPWEGLPGEVADPALAIDPERGELLLAWVSGGGETWHLWFARSRNRGTTWSAPVRVTTSDGQVHPHAEASPRLVGGPDDRVAVVWTSSIPVEGRRFPASLLWAASSRDGGRTWSEPSRVATAAAGPPGSHTFHGAAWEHDSTLVAAWLDGRGMPMDPRGVHTPSDGSFGLAEVSTPHEHPSESAVWLARSPNFGRTWETNRPLWPSACPCCRVDLARAADGGLVAAWREHFEGDVRDVVVAPVPGAGELPAEPRRVREDDWVYPACPHSGPAVAVDQQGQLQVTWFTGKPGAAGVFYARGAGPDDRSPGDPAGATSSVHAIQLVGGEELPIAHPVAVALADGGAAVAWDVEPDGNRRVSVARVSPAGEVAERLVVQGSEGADHPRLAALSEGTVVLAWTVPGERSAVRLVRVRFGE